MTIPARAAVPGGGDFGGDLDGGGGTTRVLNQDEIDSLLGFDDGQGSTGDGSGIAAIVNSALVSYERLPMLEVVFDRLVRMMSTSLRNLHLGQCRGQPRQHHVDPLRAII